MCAWKEGFTVIYNKRTTQVSCEESESNQPATQQRHLVGQRDTRRQEDWAETKGESRLLPSLHRKAFSDLNNLYK